MVIPSRLHVFLIVMAAPLALCAQDQNASQADVIRTLLTRIDRLEKRVAELEGKTPAPEPPAPAPLVSDDAHDHASAAPRSESFPAMRLTGFSDLNFSATDQRGARSGFNEGQFI